MDKFSFFVVNVFINGFLMFFTTALLLEGILFLCRIRQGRWAAFLRTLPFLKLVLDLFLYDFSRWSYLKGINPILCETGSRTITVSIGYPPTSNIQLIAPGDTTFTLADLLSYSMPSIWLNTLALLIVSLSLFFLMKQCLRYYDSFKFLNALFEHSAPIPSPIYNPSLKAYFAKKRPAILSPSHCTASPFVAGLIHPVIYISSTLATHLSQKEYEAILAHEIEHIRYKDNFLRLILGCIQSIFWWIPTRWFQNRIEEGQEIGCDLNCKKYHIDPLDLASAISKSAQYYVNAHHLPLTHSLTKRSIYKRVNTLLLYPSTLHKKTRWITYTLGTVIAYLVIFMGKFWIF